MKALATTIDEDELDGLRDQFDAIDIDKNGAISLEEMRQVRRKQKPLTQVKRFHYMTAILVCSISTGSCERCSLETEGCKSCRDSSSSKY